MRIGVRFFASQREATGLSSYQVEVRDGSSAADVLEALSTTFPRLRSAASAVAFAVNRVHSPSSTRLRDGDELALLPPLAGG